jgi:NADPH:quinone reductase-like Zn-dependent oxidoreductase
MAKTEETKMKAVVIHEYGEPDVLKYEDALKPAPADNEILLRVEYASINPFDWKIRAGYTRKWISLTLPAILGIDAAGTVEAVGSKVTEFKPGDKAFGKADFNKGGSYAEYAILKANQTAKIPAGLKVSEAAALPVTASTAYTALHNIAHVKKGQKVLVTGASGGVGQMGVQLAKAAGAYVIGTASGASIDTVKSLGADEVVNYQEGDFSAKVKNVDIAFDTVGSETFERCYSTLRKGGILVTTAGQPDEKKAKKLGIRVSGMQASSDTKMLEEIASMAAAGKIKVIIAKEFSLSEAKAAHEMSQAGHPGGKILLRVGTPYVRRN